MSGTRLFNFRQGDRSEYLATYFFSAIGLVTPVPRQEDIGFDLVCSIADQETGNLTFNNQFLVSVKSLSSPNIELHPTDNPNESLPHLSWLYRQELPLLLALIDKDNQEVRVYSTLPVWFLYFEGKPCGSMSLIPRIDPEFTDDVSRPRQEEHELSTIPGKYHFNVDLGHPIVRATINDISDTDKLKVIKDQLRYGVNIARSTITHAQLGIPYFYWFHKTYPDGSKPNSAFITYAIQSDRQNFQYTAPALISMAMHYKFISDQAKLEAIVQLLKSFPPKTIPEPVKELIPELNG